MKIKCVKYTLQLYALSALQACSIPKDMLQKWDESIVASFAGCKECSPFLLMRGLLCFLTPQHIKTQASSL